MLAQREEIAFVQLVCSACQIQTLALVTGVPNWPEDSEEVGAEPPSLVAPSEAPPISMDDVSDMRSFLATYEGDLRDLLDRGRGRDRK